jgi:hypothetical protein
MKLGKMFGFAAVAAFALMALAGASSAVANPETALCKKQTLVCAAVDRYPAGTTISGSLKSGTEAVLSGALSVKCKSSSVGGKTTGSELGPTVLDLLETTTFTNCTGCTHVLSQSTPWVSHLKNELNLKGSLIVLGPQVQLSGCPFGISCTATAAEVVLDVDTSVEPATVKAINEPLSLGLCGNGTWNAEYVLSAPKPLYIES